VPPRPLLCDKHGIERVDSIRVWEDKRYQALVELSLYGCLSVQPLCIIQHDILATVFNLYQYSNTPHLSAVIMFAMRREVRSVVRAEAEDSRRL